MWTTVGSSRIAIMTFRLYKMPEISSLAENLLASQEGFCSVEFFFFNRHYNP
jgi:hypothetical protein